MGTTKKNSKKAAPSTAQLQYLAAVEEWKASSDADRQSNASTDNHHSLLKDVVNDGREDPFFSSLMEDPTKTQGHLPMVVQGKILSELNSLYEEYSFATAKDASLTDDLRRQQSPSNPKHSDDSLVYGEINWEGFCQLLEGIPASSAEGVFYDLGSGSGRAVFAARFHGDFGRCIGIELLPNLHRLAISVQSLYKFQYQHKLKWQHVQFACSDLLDYNWSDGTLVYAPSLLFDDTVMEGIAQQALLLQMGAHLISLKKFAGNLDTFHGSFEMTQQKAVAMSWGESNVYVYRRR